MAEPKTRPTTASVDEFLTKASGSDATRLADCKTIVKMMKASSGEKAVMWGTAIVGFGSTTLVGRSGSVEWPLIAFSPRKAALTLYIGATQRPKLLAKLGKHETGKGCLYIKKLADVDMAVLGKLIDAAVDAKT